MNNYQAYEQSFQLPGTEGVSGGAIPLSQSELMQLRGEIERTKLWVKRQQTKKFFGSLSAWLVAYGVMAAINIVLFLILMIFIPALRNTRMADGTSAWPAYLLLLIPPICALPPFIPLVVGILVGVPLRRKQREQGPFFMG